VWGLNQTGNWNTNLVDLNGDNNGTDAGELNETRTHNAVNELAARDIDSDTSDDFSLAYDEVGNMTDDGEDYEYVWDVFGRLRAVYVRNTSPAKSDLVSEYRYNGLGYLVVRHQDTDTDGDVDGSDVTFETVFDERWRAVATYRAGDSAPKELFLHHAAGASGLGGSSYIDHVVLRNRDATNGWAGATDGTLEERVYYCQNWRADVVALIDGAGGMLEWVKYSAYGVPFGLPAKDADSDGDYDSADDTVISGWGAYDVRGDVNLDGVVDGGDTATLQSHGRGALTSTGVGNRRGYAGYWGDPALRANWHVRHRVMNSVEGRWLTRDLEEYVDGLSTYESTRSSPLVGVDPMGQLTEGPPVPGVDYCGLCRASNQSMDAPITRGWGLRIRTVEQQDGHCGCRSRPCIIKVLVGICFLKPNGACEELPAAAQSDPNHPLHNGHSGWHKNKVEWDDYGRGIIDPSCGYSYARGRFCTGSGGGANANSQLRGMFLLGCGSEFEQDITVRGSNVPTIDNSGSKSKALAGTEGDIELTGRLHIGCGSCNIAQQWMSVNESPNH